MKILIYLLFIFKILDSLHVLVISRSSTKFNTKFHEIIKQIFLNRLLKQ
jgi:hypothetical protein